MAITGRSARGELVDFDILQIKQQLSSNPVVIGVNERRQFIDSKDGIKRTTTETKTAMTINHTPEPSSLDDMLAVASAGVEESTVKDGLVDITTKK
jgi:hypothetical protein